MRMSLPPRAPALRVSGALLSDETTLEQKNGELQEQVTELEAHLEAATAMFTEYAGVRPVLSLDCCYVQNWEPISNNSHPQNRELNRA